MNRRSFLKLCGIITVFPTDLISKQIEPPKVVENIRDIRLVEYSKDGNFLRSGNFRVDWGIDPGSVNWTVVSYFNGKEWVPVSIQESPLDEPPFQLININRCYDLVNRSKG